MGTSPSEPDRRVKEVRISQDTSIVVELMDGLTISVPLVCVVPAPRGRGSGSSIGVDLPREEDQLREKIRSKITVSTFLAGFIFTALIQVLMLLARNESSAVKPFTLWKWETELRFLLECSTALFFLATALFVSSVYSYDRLLMPRTFWSPDYRNSKLTKMMEFFIYKIMRYPRGNRVYVYMLSVWLLMFIPATICSTVGILVIFYTVVQFEIFLAIMTITVLILIYYCLLKPRLGVD